MSAPGRSPAGMVVACFAVVALFLGACSTDPASGAVEESPMLRFLERKSGTILYQGSDLNLYTINQAGENQLAIAAEANLDGQDGQLRLYQHFAWSPDSERIAFVELYGNAEDQAFSVHTVGADGQNLQTPFTDPQVIPQLLYWSPDGSRISFLTAESGAESDLNLRLVAADGTSPAQILDNGRPLYWVWNPDSLHIAAHTDGAAESKGEPRVSLIETASGNEAVLDLPPAYFNAPAWSPDGEHLLLAGGEAGNNRLLVVDNSGQIETEIAAVEASVVFSWSPQGDYVSYITSNRKRLGVLGHLKVVQPTDPETVLETPENMVFAYFWAPNGRQIAYFTVELILVEGSPEPVRALGLYVMDVPGGDTKKLLFFNTTNQFSDVLENFDQYQRFATIWSPDSQNLVLPMVAEDDSSSIVVLTADGNLEPRPIAEGVLAFWSSK